MLKMGGKWEAFELTIIAKDKRGGSISQAKDSEAPEFGQKFEAMHATATSRSLGHFQLKISQLFNLPRALALRVAGGSHLQANVSASLI